MGPEHTTLDKCGRHTSSSSLTLVGGVEGVGGVRADITGRSVVKLGSNHTTGGDRSDDARHGLDEVSIADDVARGHVSDGLNSALSAHDTEVE